ncbi:MAG: 2-C-methyl-D-erythritol 4-phosphate cytidylyltransferase, partial [Roseburia sp.]|nr:2-C-methyl-D-erythritol 4-phosphate cytidylyltransferase [Roseburia sp.]
MKTTAIVLAAGAGKRMNSKVQKQYLLLKEKPVLYYSLKAFEESQVEDIILVVGAGEIEYCQKEIIEKYGIQKVRAIVAGGKERYHSVYEGLKAAGQTDYVLIHDGARPFVSQAIIERTIAAVSEYKACVVGMPVKDTIKIADEAGYAKETPNRSRVWMVQTPQAFSYSLIYDAYTRM